MLVMMKVLGSDQWDNDARILSLKHVYKLPTDGGKKITLRLHVPSDRPPNNGYVVFDEPDDGHAVKRDRSCRAVLPPMPDYITTDAGRIKRVTDMFPKLAGLVVLGRDNLR